jgi:hypothetical protein
MPSAHHAPWLDGKRSGMVSLVDQLPPNIGSVAEMPADTGGGRRLICETAPTVKRMATNLQNLMDRIRQKLSGHQQASV